MALCPQCDFCGTGQAVTHWTAQFGERTESSVESIHYQTVGGQWPGLGRDDHGNHVGQS